MSGEFGDVAAFLYWPGILKQPHKRDHMRDSFDIDSLYPSKP